MQVSTLVDKVNIVNLNGGNLQLLKSNGTAELAYTETEPAFGYVTIKVRLLLTEITESLRSFQYSISSRGTKKHQCILEENL